MTGASCVVDRGLTGRWFQSASCKRTLTLLLVVHNWGNKRPWYVQPCMCDWAYKRSRATYRKRVGHRVPVVGFLLVSFIKLSSSPDWIRYDCMFSPWRWPSMLTGRKTFTLTQTIIWRQTFSHVIIMCVCVWVGGWVGWVGGGLIWCLNSGPFKLRMT